MTLPTAQSVHLVQTGPQQSASMDHLVVLAATLQQGIAWCEATLGVTPGPGGEHPLMGTHNRLLHIATSTFSTAFLEIIAINPDADPRPPARGRRWFDMDDSNLRERIAQQGPALVHFVAAVPDIHHSLAALSKLGIDRGDAVQISRQTATGLLQWQISVRADGERLFDGCLPTLIQWGDTHPIQRMPPSAATLLDLQVHHPQADRLHAAFDSIQLTTVSVHPGPPQLRATLQTPKGLIEIHS